MTGKYYHESAAIAYIVLALDKDGGTFKTKTKFDITTDMLLHDRNKYDEKLRGHKLSQLQRYIDDHIHNNIYA